MSNPFRRRDASPETRRRAAEARRADSLPRARPPRGDARAGAIAAAGFEIERRWEPGRNKALFVVARKSE